VSERLDWNAKTIAEFRANQGRVGGNFAGAPLVLVHHRGRKSGREYVTPMMYLPHGTEPDIIYVLATRAGAPTNPDWCYNLTAAGDGSVERGTQTYRATIRELTGAERDRIYAEQARRYPGLAEYARQTAGVAPFPCSNLGARSPLGEGFINGPTVLQQRQPIDGSAGTSLAPSTPQPPFAWWIRPTRWIRAAITALFHH
jgi:deazaflavin-dependent oxidoreductase (nitroreductase family)